MLARQVRVALRKADAKGDDLVSMYGDVKDLQAQ